MKEETPRYEAIMAGIGGKGVLIAGQVLTWAGAQKYKYATWIPIYFATMRGGACECTVILSDEEIASLLLNRAQAVVVFEPSQLKDFEGRVKPQGILIAESRELPEVGRQDIQVIRVPAMEIAAKLGEVQAANFVLLGAYIGVSGAVPPELIEAEIGQRFSGKEETLSLNKNAFKEGLLFAAKQ